MNVRKARIGLIQLMFQNQIQGNFDDEMCNIFLESMNFESEEAQYIKENSQNLIADLDKIDKTISDNLRGWSFERLSKMDLSILRVAVYEMLVKKDLAPAISINEAVEIAKKYGTNDSSKFINGILGTIYRSMKD